MPSRRALLGGLGLSAAAATSGCLGDLTDDASAGRSFALDEARLAFREGFDAEAAELSQGYGDVGVWGTESGPDTAPEVEYVGARAVSWAVPGVERSGGRPFAFADCAAVVYRVGGRRRVWFWVGARPRQVDGRLGRTNVSQVRVATDPGPGWELTAAAPRTPTREGPVAVSLDGRGPSATVPLEGGGVAADTLELGPEGRIEVAWQGISGDPRAVHAVVEYAPTGSGEPFSPPVSTSVAATRGVL